MSSSALHRSTASGRLVHCGRSALEHDLARRTELAAAGWLVLHFSWRDLVGRPQFVVAEVARAIETRNSAP